jgi:hypothetical protein
MSITCWQHQCASNVMRSAGRYVSECVLERNQTGNIAVAPQPLPVQSCAAQPAVDTHCNCMFSASAACCFTHCLNEPVVSATTIKCLTRSCAILVPLCLLQVRHGLDVHWAWLWAACWA